MADASAATGLGDDGTTNTRFYPKTPSAIAPIGPGRYAVIGPGEPADTGQSVTYLGGRKDPNPSDPNADPDDMVTFDGQCRRIILNPTATGQQVTIENNGTGSGAVPGGIKDAVAVPISQPRRLNVTDPEDGYPVPDNATTTPPSYATIYDTPLDAGEDAPDETNKTGTYPNFCVVHLQRLANPLKPYDATTNPYRTIDSMPVDLHSFNGTSNKLVGGAAESEDDLELATWERGEAAKAEAEANSWSADPINLWRQEPLGATTNHDPQLVDPLPGSAESDHYLRAHLQHTLSYLNRVFGTPRTSPAGYEGDPPRPFPWLTWLNRPLVNQYELLLVPAPQSSKLLATYRIVRETNPEFYAPSDVSHIPFPHLPDFFHSEGTSASGALRAPMFYRLLDFVGVPSPFVGTEIQGPPTNFATGTHFFRPPFNHIPLYRDPGRVNINTMFSPAVGEGMVNYAPGLWDMKLWEKFVVSRRGRGQASGSTDPTAIQTKMLEMDSNYPTRFANPFRPWSGANLMPQPIRDQRPSTWREIDATLLRPAPPDASGGTTNQRPLFDFRSAQQVNDTDENPYFRYQGFQRLGSLLTTRSNVYAVWITVGYFEAEANPGGVVLPAYPDGYRLGRELGMDTGEVKRHRAFYIFDRSIPVGFQRGKDLNVEKAILLQRFIE